MDNILTGAQLHSLLASGSAVAQLKCRTPERRLGIGNLPRHVVSLSKTLYSPKVLLLPRKRWLRPDLTEKLLTGTLRLNLNADNPLGSNFFH